MEFLRRLVTPGLCSRGGSFTRWCSSPGGGLSCPSAGFLQDRLRVAAGFRQSERSKRERLGASCPYNDLVSQAAAQCQLGSGPFAGSESLSLNARGGQPDSTLERSVKGFVDAL